MPEQIPLQYLQEVFFATPDGVPNPASGGSDGNVFIVAAVEQPHAVRTALGIDLRLPILGLMVRPSDY